MMTKESMELEELNNKHINGVELEEEESSLSDIDFATLFLVAKKSIIWVLLLLIVGGAGAYFYLRYTKPVYKSSSAIKLEVQSEAGALGLAKLGDEGRQNLIKLSGEIELIKSNLIFEKLKDALNLHVNYFAEGNVLDQELYKNSPFNVVYEVKNKGLYDTPVSVKILDENKYRLSYQKGNETVQGEYRFNEVVTNADVILQLRLNDGYSSDLTERNFYFVINSDGALKRYLNENLFVDIINLDASTLGISFTDHTPLKAKDIVNKLDTVYLEQKLEQNNLAKEQTIAFLNRQLLETRDSLQKAEVEMEYFAQRNKTFDVKGDINRLLTSIEELNKESTELGQKIALLNELQRLVDTDSDVEQILPTLGMIEDQQLAEQIKLVSEKQLLRNQALKGSRSNTGAVASIESDIRFIKKNIRELIVRNKQLLQKQVANVNSRTSGIEAELLKIPSKGTEYDRLKRFFDLYEKYYLTLMDKKVEFGIAKAGTTPDFQILSHASLPSEPISPNPIIIYAIGLGAGLFLGIGLIAGRYFLHNTVTNLREMERALNVPVLGVVPTYSKEKLSTSKMVVDKNPKSAISESIRSIRTNLEFLASAKKKRIISVSSTISGEGKTFVAVNLGAIIAMTGQRVVILDLDMRKPKVHLAFDADNYKGMSTVLIERNDIYESIQKTSIESLDFISAGPTPPNPSELILSTKFDEVLNELHQLYDVIIIDSPPVGVVTDGVLIMRKADVPLYVVRAEYSKKEFLKNINRIAKANRFTKLAAVLNDARSTSMYGYDYGYGYGYGYGYYDEPEEKGVLTRIKGKIKS